MTVHLETRFEITSWDEKPYREVEGGERFTRAEVSFAASDDTIDVEATWEALLYYRPDGTSTYAGLMRVTGRLGDRTGTFVMQGTGTYDGEVARGESRVVPGSGTGGLAGISGTSRSESTHADYPHMPFTLDYELA